MANPSDTSERSPARDVPWPIANPSDSSEQGPARDVPRPRSKPGRRASWKQRQTSRINNDDDNTGFDADTDSAVQKN